MVKLHDSLILLNLVRPDNLRPVSLNISTFRWKGSYIRIIWKDYQYFLIKIILLDESFAHNSTESLRVCGITDITGKRIMTNVCFPMLFTWYLIINLLYTTLNGQMSHIFLHFLSQRALHYILLLIKIYVWFLQAPEQDQRVPSPSGAQHTHTQHCIAPETGLCSIRNILVFHLIHSFIWSYQVYTFQMSIWILFIKL